MLKELGLNCTVSAVRPSTKVQLSFFSTQKEEQLCSEGGSSSEDQFSESELGIDEIQLLLQAMQFRRFVKNRFLNSFFRWGEQ